MALTVAESVCNAERDPGSLKQVGKTLEEEGMATTQCFLPGEFVDRGLVSYSPWSYRVGHTED